MSMYKSFETDKDIERQGVWLDYGQFRIRIARAGGANKDFKKVLDRLTRPHRRVIANDSMDEAVAAGILRRAYAKAVILDWETRDKAGDLQEGIEQKDSDELLPPSLENIVITLRALPDLFTDIQEQATSSALYKATLRDDAAGN